MQSACPNDRARGVTRATLFQCWASVKNGGPTLKQRCHPRRYVRVLSELIMLLLYLQCNFSVIPWLRFWHRPPCPAGSGVLPPVLPWSADVCPPWWCRCAWCSVPGHTAASIPRSGAPPLLISRSSWSRCPCSLRASTSQGTPPGSPCPSSSARCRGSLEMPCLQPNRENIHISITQRRKYRHKYNQKYSISGVAQQIKRITEKYNW